MCGTTAPSLEGEAKKAVAHAPRKQNTAQDNTPSVETQSYTNSTSVRLRRPTKWALRGALQPTGQAIHVEEVRATKRREKITSPVRFEANGTILLLRSVEANLGQRGNLLVGESLARQHSPQLEDSLHASHEAVV
mmetsp:Transcript_37604/g.99995  ORF Transcript_37604/g.99995 Transcript_37604/m.99995 type:complete len:135 (-) Transcript_37604:939-1343(-)